MMTEKRFTFEFDNYNGRLFDNNYQTFYHIEDSEENIELLCNRLNELHEENRGLQRHLDVMRSGALTDDKRIKELYEENEQLKSFKSEVFELIDKKINKLKNTNEVSLIPRESVEILKELKKELEK